MLITEYIDKRIAQLQSIRKEQLKDNPFESSQRWARIDELKKLKDKYTGKDGKWLF